ncbi:unnamed protein product, partial [Lymnaea stagnalis]
MTTTNDSSMSTFTNGSDMSTDVISLSSDDTSCKKSETITNDICASTGDVVTHSSDRTTISQSRTQTEDSCMSINVMPMSFNAKKSNKKKTCKHFNAYVSKFTSDEGFPFTMGYVYNTYTTLGNSISKTSELLLANLKAKGHDCTPISVHSALNRFVRNITMYKKDKSKNWFRIKSYLNEWFRVPQRKTKKPTLAVVTDDPTLLSGDDVNQEKAIAMEPEIRLKTDCEKCPAIRQSYRKAIAEFKDKLRASKLTIREMSKRFDVKRVNQDIKRKVASRLKLREKIQALRKENLSLKKEVENLKIVVERDYGAIARAEKRKRKRTELEL